RRVARERDDRQDLGDAGAELTGEREPLRRIPRLADRAQEPLELLVGPAAEVVATAAAEEGAEVAVGRAAPAHEREVEAAGAQPVAEDRRAADALVDEDAEPAQRGHDDLAHRPLAIGDEDDELEA